MPSYNSQETISESIISIIEQSYQEWELIITDDNSQDDTVKIIEQIAASEPRIKLYVLSENSGAGIARNNSIKHANGRFIAFLDSDDIWGKEKLSKQVNFMKDNDFSLTYTAYEKIDGKGLYRGAVIPPYKVNYKQLLKSNVIGCLTAMYDTRTLGKVYMPTLRKRQDMALWLLILSRIDYAYCLQEVLCKYREGHVSLSSNKLKVIFSQWDFYRKYLKFSLVKSSWYFSFYIVKALQKHRLKT